MRKLTVLLSLAVLLAGCAKRGVEMVEAAAKPGEPPAVRVAAAEARRVPRAVQVTGSLVPDESVSVSAEVAGRLAEVQFDFGQQVRKGEIIAELDKREFSIQCDRARAALAQALARIGLDPKQEDVTPQSTAAIRQAEAQYEDARFKYESASQLIKSGDISRERFVELEKAFHARGAALQAARDDLRTQLANVQALQAELRLSEKRLSDATVRAPFDGSVTARLVSPGQYMKENTPIVTLVKTSPLRLRADIPETAASQVRTGSALSFTTGAAPGAVFRAVVRELNPALDSRSRALTVEARLAGSDPRLRAGMFVQVEVGLAQDSEAIVVPKEALYQIAGLTKLFVVREGRAWERKVTAGEEIGGGWIEVPGESVRPGDMVALTKLPLLTDGMEVRTEGGR